MNKYPNKYTINTSISIDEAQGARLSSLSYSNGFKINKYYAIDKKESVDTYSSLPMPENIKKINLNNTSFESQYENIAEYNILPKDIDYSMYNTLIISLSQDKDIDLLIKKIQSVCHNGKIAIMYEAKKSDLTIADIAKSVNNFDPVINATGAYITNKVFSSDLNPSIQYDTYLCYDLSTSLADLNICLLYHDCNFVICNTTSNNLLDITGKTDDGQIEWYVNTDSFFDKNIQDKININNIVITRNIYENIFNESADIDNIYGGVSIPPANIIQSTDLVNVPLSEIIPQFLMAVEGVVLERYTDGYVGGQQYYSIGIGHQIKDADFAPGGVLEGMDRDNLVITKQIAIDLFYNDAVLFHKEVIRQAKKYNFTDYLTQNVYDGMFLNCYAIWFKDDIPSAIAKYLKYPTDENSESMQKTITQYCRYRKEEGDELVELDNVRARRQLEANLIVGGETAYNTYKQMYQAVGVDFSKDEQSIKEMLGLK